MSRIPIRLSNPRKYRNQPQVVDGLRFDSKKEARRYQDLKLLLRAEKIHSLQAEKRHLSFPLKVNHVLICTYQADFLYFDRDRDEWVLEDVKGFKTPAYRIKKKLMKAILGIEIREV